MFWSCCVSASCLLCCLFQLRSRFLLYLLYHTETCLMSIRLCSSTCTGEPMEGLAPNTLLTGNSIPWRYLNLVQQPEPLLFWTTEVLRSTRGDLSLLNNSTNILSTAAHCSHEECLLWFDNSTEWYRGSCSSWIFLWGPLFKFFTSDAKTIPEKYEK